MWNALKSIFRRPPVMEESDPAYDEVKRLVENLLAQDYSSRSERTVQDAQVIDALKRLDKEIEAIRAAAHASPGGTVPTQVWLNGVGYANLCRKLTLHLREADWLLREENASALWAKATLAVSSHCHHLVGPAMLANADCQERLGNAARAAQMYRAVVGDFEFLLDDDRPDGPRDEEERTAIESLRTAADRLLALGAAGNQQERMAEIRKNADSALA